jgi:hypothetical protein
MVLVHLDTVEGIERLVSDARFRALAP